MAHTIKALKALKKFRDRVTHEVPTGPHTDVKKRRLNPSFLDKSIESGRTKERKRKDKIMGMGVKNVLKRMVGQKEGGRIGLKHGGGGAQQHYLQHGYGPHKLKVAKASDKALRGNKLTKKA